MNKAVFLDRDGVVNIDHGYVYRPGDFAFVDGIFALCRHFQQQDYLIVVITNQSGIARGYFSEQDFQLLSEWMCQRFAEHGVTLTAIYHCPHHPGYGPEHERHCDCRKPQPGMLLRACREHDIDAAASILIGDKDSDMAAGQAAGVGKCIQVVANASLRPLISSFC